MALRDRYDNDILKAFNRIANSLERIGRTLSNNDPEIKEESNMNYLEERYKTCGRCTHDGDSPDIVGSYCYLCKRNPDDHRIDYFEQRKEEKE